MSSEMSELTGAQLARAMDGRVRRRLRKGEIREGKDISDFRRYVGMSQTKFALALGISVHTLRNWEQGRRRPEGPALALLRLAARHPRLLKESLEAATAA